MTTWTGPVRATFGGLLALGACYLAYHAWAESRFAYRRTVDAAAAHAARPLDSLAASKAIDARMARQPGTPPTPSELTAAKQALARTPLSRGLLRILGIGAESRNDLAGADAAFGLSDALSRRDALTQLWLIERSVGKADMSAAVSHYHAVMSTHPELRPLLFSILAKAIAYPSVRTALRPYIARRALWSNGMLNAAVVEGNPVDVAELILPLGGAARGPSFEGLNANLFSRLAERGEFGSAWKLAKAVVAQFDSRSFQAFAVNDVTTDKRLGSLAWVLTEDGQFIASSSGNGGLDVEVQPLSKGIVAMRTVPIVGGKTYRFSQTMRGGDSSSRLATSAWEGDCVSQQGKTKVWRQALPSAGGEKQRQTWLIAVPSGCKGMQFVLAVGGPEGQQPAHLVIDALDLKPDAE